MARETQVHFPAKPVFWAGKVADALTIEDASVCAEAIPDIAVNAAKAIATDRVFLNIVKAPSTGIQRESGTTVPAIVNAD
jgi:hypothetical protein